MPVTDLAPSNRQRLASEIAQAPWTIACLCAAWCGTCGSYRATFEALSEKHPDKLFIWIDIEDQADVVGDLDVENFPTLLIQRGATVAFFGTTLPDLGTADRLVQAQAAHTAAELDALTVSSAERRAWQRDANLISLLAG